MGKMGRYGRPLFARYLFIRVDLGQRHCPDTFQHAAIRLVRHGGLPRVVTEEVIEVAVRREDSDFG